MSPDQQALLIIMLLLAGALLFAIGRVLTAWIEHHVSRHDLIVESRRRRLEYFNALARREQEEHAVEEMVGDVVIEDDEPIQPALAA